jgi:crossover junction endodeoxyribonuclease RuvC
VTKKYSVVAIDPSLTGLAVVCAVSDDSFYQEFTSKPAKTLKERLSRYNHLALSVSTLVAREAPRLCLIEGYSFSSKGSSFISLAEFGGILRNRVVGFSDVTVEVPPTTLKKFITGKGNASKMDVVSVLSSKYSMVFKTDNHADAFGLSRLGLAALGLIETTNKHEREAVSIVQGLMEKEDS